MPVDGRFSYSTSSPKYSLAISQMGGTPACARGNPDRYFSLEFAELTWIMLTTMNTAIATRAVTNFLRFIAIILSLWTGPAAAAPAGSPWGANYFPNIPLVNQDGKTLRFYDDMIKGKVVAINFIYTSCVLPQFCYRLANHFGVVQKRFNERMGRDLVLLTVTFDPARDTPERLAEYAAQWKADPASWRFLTGTVADVRRVCSLFGVDSFVDEGLINHSTRTAVIDRRGAIAASIDGNTYTAAQLGDLVETVLAR